MKRIGHTNFARLPIVLAAAVLAGCAGNQQLAPPSAGSVINPERGSRGNPPFYEVAGKRYHVMNSSDGFRESGIASWYGRDFHGRTTSSGEIYDMYSLTAAHKSLPLPTWVEVTNLTNGKRVIVKVNDRGPFVDGRVIDLSLRAADELGMIEAGTARVQVRALGAPATEPPLVAAAEPPPAEGRGGGFSFISEARADTVGPDSRPFRPLYIQVGAFADRNNANRLAERLKKDGFAGSFVLTMGEGRDRIHRVRIGPIQANEFDRIQAGLRAVGVNDSRLVQDTDHEK
jgi:rare lipoprotein A